ncbi:MAG: hypothetical protein AABW72_06130 [archaeon]
MKLKSIIFLIIIVAAVYFFYWNLDFKAANQKLNALDEKYLNGVIPVQEKSSEYKTAMGLLKNEFAFRGPSAEKNAIMALIDMRLKTIELLDAQKALDSKYKLLNTLNLDCDSIYYADFTSAFDSLESDLEAIAKMAAKFEKDFSAYEDDAYVKALKDSMEGMKQGIENQKQIINEEC